ncbi:hypothetical protein EVAR_36541_1 [Eumeta japonica]|uniref:Uncharacterized protein n=1 Tax=Eumeta variegata TaxID=151549 RepID=A0A4C1Z9R4_EUMVA|nr:hypothetical protein EVAR_36541_1 [Eumeta japonica]
MRNAWPPSLDCNVYSSYAQANASFINGSGIGVSVEVHILEAPKLRTRSTFKWLESGPKRASEKGQTRQKRYSQSSSNSMELDIPVIKPSNIMDSPALPAPALIQDKVKIVTSATEEAVNCKATGVKPIALPKIHPTSPVYLRDKSKWSSVSAPCDRLHTHHKNARFPICFVHRLHERDGRPLSLTLAVSSKNDSAKEMCKNLSKVCGLSGITVEPPYKKERPEQYHRRTDKGRPIRKTPSFNDIQNFPTLGNKTKKTLFAGELRPSHAPIRNPLFRNQPPRATPEPTKVSIRPKPSGSALDSEKSSKDSLFGFHRRDEEVEPLQDPYHVFLSMCPSVAGILLDDESSDSMHKKR